MNARRERDQRAASTVRDVPDVANPERITTQKIIGIMIGIAILIPVLAWSWRFS